jgi:hypothetical protein
MTLRTGESNRLPPGFRLFSLIFFTVFCPELQARSGIRNIFQGGEKEPVGIRAAWKVHAFLLFNAFPFMRIDEQSAGLFSARLFSARLFSARLFSARLFSAELLFQSDRVQPASDSPAGSSTPTYGRCRN